MDEITFKHVSMTYKISIIIPVYNEDYRIMEDFEMIERLQSVSKFKIIPKSVLVSARKYKDNNYLKVNLANLIVFMMYLMDISQETMIKTYTRLIYNSRHS